MLIGFYLVFIIIENCSSADLPSNNVTVPSQSSTNIVSNRKSEQIENIYIESMVFDETRTDPVCALPKGKKIALCEQVFQLRDYNSLNIYLSKVAFSIAKLSCEEKILLFKTKSDDGKQVKQKMYSCHGRHDPVRTSFIEDTHYDTFYVSAGPVDDSVMVYAHIISTYSHFDWYSVHNYLENVKLSELRDVSITVAEISQELLESNKKIAVTGAQTELEYIYIREKDEIKSDPICELTYEEKISFCRFIFEQHIFKIFFSITSNKAANFLLSLSCNSERLKIRFSEQHQNVLFEQNMYPCFARNKEASGNVLLDENLKRFYVSAGPRENSVFVYERVHNVTDNDKFHLFQLLENVSTRKLEHAVITLEELFEESSTTAIQVCDLVTQVADFLRNPEGHQSDKTGMEVQKQMKKGKQKIVEKEKLLRSQKNVQEKYDEFKRSFDTIHRQTLRELKKERDREKKEERSMSTKEMIEKALARLEEQRKLDEIQPRKPGITMKTFMKVLKNTKEKKQEPDKPIELRFRKAEETEKGKEETEIGRQIMDMLKGKPETMELSNKASPEKKKGTEKGEESAKQKLRKGKRITENKKIDGDTKIFVSIAIAEISEGKNEGNSLAGEKMVIEERKIGGKKLDEDDDEKKEKQSEIKVSKKKKKSRMRTEK